MGPIRFEFPLWFILLAVIGAASITGGFVYFLIWLSEHVRFV